nr:MAG TPA: hypothetical protein [Caudoviricetes sp.]
MTDKMWHELLQAISVNGESMAEQSMEIAKKQDNKESYLNAQSMRKTFQDITDSIKDGQDLTSSDYLYLFMSATLIAEHLKKEISKKQVVVDEYENHILPQLKDLALSSKKSAETLEAKSENNA